MVLSSVSRFLQKDYSFLLIPLVLYIPFVFLGYGADSDSYETLRTGTTFITNFDYVPSRNPGYLVFEVITLFVNFLGGSIATNLTAVLMSLVCLYGFHRLCVALLIPNARYLALIAAAHPYYWVASTTTMDYVFALGFFFLGVALLIDGKKSMYAGIAFSLAIGCRVTTALLVVLVLVMLLIRRLVTFKDAFTSLLVMIPFSVIFYLPSLDFVGWRWWRIFRLEMGESEYWSLFLRVGRFFYKNAMFWSIPVLLFFAGVILYVLVRRKKLEKSSLITIAACFMIFLAYESLFYFAPLDPSYLLTILPFTLMVLGILIHDNRKALLMLLILILISNFAVINIARPNVKNFATGAVYGVWLDQGYLVEDTNRRMILIDCTDLNCYESRTQN